MAIHLYKTANSDLQYAVDCINEYLVNAYGATSSDIRIHYDDEFDDEDALQDIELYYEIAETEDGEELNLGVTADLINCEIRYYAGSLDFPDFVEEFFDATALGNYVLEMTYDDWLPKITEALDLPNVEIVDFG